MFIHSLIDGHLGCFHFLAVTKYAAMNTCVQVSGGHTFSFCLGVYLGMLGHMVTVKLQQYTLIGVLKGRHHFCDS